MVFCAKVQSWYLFMGGSLLTINFQSVQQVKIYLQFPLTTSLLLYAWWIYYLVNFILVIQRLLGFLLFQSFDCCSQFDQFKEECDFLLLSFLFCLFTRIFYIMNFPLSVFPTSILIYLLKFCLDNLFYFSSFFFAFLFKILNKYNISIIIKY